MIFTSRASSTHDLLLTFRSQNARLQNQLNDASKELATGRKNDVYKSLGFGASEVLALRTQFERNEGFIASNKLLENKLEVTSEIIGNIRSITQDFLNTLIPNAENPSASANDLQAAAITALEQVTGHLNTTYQNGALFSGIDSDKIPLQNFNQVNPVTGLSPNDVLDSIVGSGISNATDAANKLSDLEDIFNNANTTQPERNFEATFYNGSPLLQTDGSAVARLQGQIDKNLSLSYGVQANDPEIKNIIHGLSIIASTDISEIANQDAYSVWTNTAIDSLTSGINGLINTEANLGRQRGILEEKIIAQQNIEDIYSSRISDLENVDPLEAATRVQQLETQLQASYSITARISRLSFLNFI